MQLLIAIVILIFVLAVYLCVTTESMAPIINRTRVVTLHYVNWCPHCQIMKPIWSRVKMATKGSGIVFKELDEDVAKTPGVNGYPTIRMIDEHGFTSDYSGQPNFENLRAWVVSPLMPKG